MKKVLEEIGKGLINFANIVTALVFVKEYFDKNDSNLLLYGFVFWLTVYLFGSILIKKSEES
jgi:hypothetical protein